MHRGIESNRIVNRIIVIESNRETSEDAQPYWDGHNKSILNDTNVTRFEGACKRHADSTVGMSTRTVAHELNVNVHHKLPSMVFT